MNSGLGLDYSDARPGGALLKAHNVEAVGRYLATDSRGITAAEYADLQAYGIGLWLVFESQTSDLSVSMLNGYAKGVSDAQRAQAQIVAQGLPADSPIYWAADFDIAPGTNRVSAAESYVDGWNTVIPAGRRGGYGGLWFLNYIHGRGKVDFLWECASTSFRHGVDPSSVPLHIQQTVDTPPIPGTDHNNIYDTTSFAGQHATNLSEEDDNMKLIRDSSNGSLALVGEAYFGEFGGADKTGIDAAVAVFGPVIGVDATQYATAKERALGRQQALISSIAAAVKAAS